MEGLPEFGEADFAPFEGARQRDRSWDARRLAVRRKLEAYAKAARKALRERCGLEFALRTSVHHPHATNRHRVRGLRAYLTRTPSERRLLTERFDGALAADTRTHYVQATIALAIDESGLRSSLSIHAQAFWDSMNLANKLREPAGEAAFLDLLHALPGPFRMRNDRHRKEYRAGDLSAGELRNFVRYFEPGVHGFALEHVIPRADLPALGPALAPLLLEDLVALGPAYRFLLWSPANDHLFDADGRLRRAP